MSPALQPAPLLAASDPASWRTIPDQQPVLTSAEVPGYGTHGKPFPFCSVYSAHGEPQTTRLCAQRHLRVPGARAGSCQRGLGWRVDDKVEAAIEDLLGELQHRETGPGPLRVLNLLSVLNKGHPPNDLTPSLTSFLISSTRYLLETLGGKCSSSQQTPRCSCPRHCHKARAFCLLATPCGTPAPYFHPLPPQTLVLLQPSCLRLHTLLIYSLHLLTFLNLFFFLNFKTLSSLYVLSR